jgi:archaetidylinositol phosphate synthase
MTDISKHHRTLDTFTGPLEKRLLRWLAARLPAWINPDSLTGIGVVGSLIIAGAYWLTMYDRAFLWLASLGFVINWFGDSLDGTLARYRKIERPQYGFYIDHIVDAFNEALVFLGLGLSPYVRFDLACIALILYLMISVMVYVYTCVIGEFKLSYGGLGPTEARLIGIGANTIIFFIGAPNITLFSFTLTSFDWIVIGIILLELGILIVSTIKQTRYLAWLETTKKR